MDVPDSLIHPLQEDSGNQPTRPKSTFTPNLGGTECPTPAPAGQSGPSNPGQDPTICSADTEIAQFCAFVGRVPALNDHVELGKLFSSATAAA